MIMSVSTLIIGKGAATPVRVVNFSIWAALCKALETVYVTAQGPGSSRPERPPADIAPAVSLGPADAIDRPVGTIARFGQICGGRRHIQDPSAGGDDATILTAPGAGMKERNALHRRRFLQSFDEAAGLGFPRIALRGHDDSKRRRLVPAQIEIPQDA